MNQETLLREGRQMAHILHETLTGMGIPVGVSVCTDDPYDETAAITIEVEPEGDGFDTFVVECHDAYRAPHLWWVSRRYESPPPWNTVLIPIHELPKAHIIPPAKTVVRAFADALVTAAWENLPLDDYDANE